MVDILPPFSMPSTTVLSTHKLGGPLPSLSQIRTFTPGWDQNKHTYTERGVGQNAPSKQLQSYTVRAQHGLKTPPEEMTGSSNANPLLAPLDGLHYKSVPIAGSNAALYQTNQDIHGNSRYPSKPQPFYDSYQSVQQPQSPAPRGESIRSREQPARRRASSDGNSIVSYLQIPPSINNSKGSLADFAAQVRSLFPILAASSLTKCR